MTTLDTDPLPSLLRDPPTHEKLKDARFTIDPKTNAPYLLMEDVDGGRVRVFKFNRVKAMNAFDDRMYLVVADALNAAEKDEKVLIVVLTGAGEYFSSGADLHAAVEGDNSLKSGQGMPLDPVGVFMRIFLRFPKPIVAAVNGPAIGVGCTMLVHCDTVFATDDAYFLLPFSRMAFVPEFGSSKLFPEVLGKSTANEMILFSKPLQAAKAKERGLVSEIFPKQGFLEKVLAEVHNGIVHPLMERTLPLFKHMMRKWTVDDMERLIVYELNKLDERSNNGDPAEAIIEFFKSKKAGKSAL